MGGSVDVFSEVGVGTEFQIRIKSICKGVAKPVLKPFRSKIYKEEHKSSLLSSRLDRSAREIEQKYFVFIWKNPDMQELLSSF